MLLFILIALMMVSCRKNRDVGSESETQLLTEDISLGPTEMSSELNEASARVFVCNDIRSSFYTEEYVLHHDNHGQLRIFDAIEKTDHIFCFDPGCDHSRSKRSKTGEIIKMGCMSYEMSSNTVMLEGDSCYFLDGYGQVIVSDLQGMNRRIIGTLPSYLYRSCVSDVFFSEDALFVVYYLDYEVIETKGEDGETIWIAGGMKDEITRGILRIDLSDGKCTDVFKGEDCTSYLSQHDVRSGHLYFSYWYSDIPYVDEYEGSYGKPIPEELTALSLEEYREEKRKRTWVDIYDYNTITGELNVCLKKKHTLSGRVAFCNGFFAVVEDDGATGLYRYNGEMIRELDFTMNYSIWSENNLLCTTQEQGVFILIDENTGEVLRRTRDPISPSVFSPLLIIGESCYGHINRDGVSWEGYVPTEDFWNGDMTHAVQFSEE